MHVHPAPQLGVQSKQAELEVSGTQCRGYPVVQALCREFLVCWLKRRAELAFAVCAVIPPSEGGPSCCLQHTDLQGVHVGHSHAHHRSHARGRGNAPPSLLKLGSHPKAASQDEAPLPGWHIRDLRIWRVPQGAAFRTAGIPSKLEGGLTLWHLHHITACCTSCTARRALLTQQACEISQGIRRLRQAWPGVPSHAAAARGEE